MIKEVYDKGTKFTIGFFTFDIIVSIGTIIYLLASNIDRLTVFCLSVVLGYIIFLCAYTIIISLIFDKNRKHI